MDLFLDGLWRAFRLMLGGDAEVWRITLLSLQVSGTATLLSLVLGLPLGTALSILQVLDDDSVAHLLIALGLSVAATAAALTTRYGRLVLSSLRGGDRGA